MHASKTIKANPVGRRKERGEESRRVFQLQSAHIKKFLIALKENGRSDNTVVTYRRDLNNFYEFLDGDCWVCSDSLKNWRDALMRDGYAPRTINRAVIAVNSMFNFLGHRDLQLFEWVQIEDAPMEDGAAEEAMSREEYLLLLNEAKRQENIQFYLIIKLLACTPLNLNDVKLVTREAVNDGEITGKTWGDQDRVAFPGQLRSDLLDYAVMRGVRTGPLFLSSNGNPLNRTLITRSISMLGEDAGISAGKATPINLRKLYQQTRADFQEQANAWVESSYVRLLEQEEALSGWRVPVKTVNKNIASL